METVLVKYGKLKEDLFLRLFDSLGNFSTVQLSLLWDDLSQFRANEFAELHRIFRLPLDNSPNGPELWDRLLQYGQRANQFPEVKLFRAQAKVCRQVWFDILKKYSDLLIKPKAKDLSNGEETNSHNDQDSQSAPALPIRP
jgi:hypothetical protein